MFVGTKEFKRTWYSKEFKRTWYSNDGTENRTTEAFRLKGLGFRNQGLLKVSTSTFTLRAALGAAFRNNELPSGKR